VVDKVKPLKLESPTGGGTETDPFPTETDPLEDYLSSKGMAFEGLDEFRTEKVGRMAGFRLPDGNYVAHYDSNGDMDYQEVYQGVISTPSNRVARVDYTYTAGELTLITIKLYASNGTTVLETTSYTPTYVSGDITEFGEVTT
jgi:hypothetical protein